jgi:hypothetical protein
MGRFQLELIYLYFPPSSHGTMVENKGKLIQTLITLLKTCEYMIRNIQAVRIETH